MNTTETLERLKEIFKKYSLPLNHPIRQEISDLIWNINNGFSNIREDTETTAKDTNVQSEQL